MVSVMCCVGARSYNFSSRHPGLEPEPIHPPLPRLPYGSRLKAGMRSACEAAYE